MEKDTIKTKVKFKKFRGEIIALFPEIGHCLFSNTIESYMHIGQHGGAHKDLLKCRNATPEQYYDLYNELESIGYNLEVL